MLHGVLKMAYEEYDYGNFEDDEEYDDPLEAGFMMGVELANREISEACEFEE